MIFLHERTSDPHERKKFIPDPADANNGPISGSSGGEGVVADADGVIYSAEVGPWALKRYVRYIDP